MRISHLPARLYRDTGQVATPFFRLPVVRLGRNGDGRPALAAWPLFGGAASVTRRRCPVRPFNRKGSVSRGVLGEGRAQACMGVALGDADGDGRLDIFVTNFRNESNTLYVSKPTPDASSLLFVDDTRRAGLRAPSFEMLGFGTQFLDADLDGREDLVVANGHVGDLRQHGVEYQMRPQFFRNVGQGRFEELRGVDIGPFFDEKHLGRGLAKWDWNRDGRPDFVVNQLQERTAIVTNETERPGHFLDVRLSGTRSSRDAIGARVRAVVKLDGGGERVVRGQLTAGDGYMASNQRHVLLGLGDSDRIERVEVDWPSGARSSIEGPTVDQELLVVEP